MRLLSWLLNFIPWVGAVDVEETYVRIAAGGFQREIVTTSKTGRRIVVRKEKEATYMGGAGYNEAKWVFDNGRGKATVERVSFGRDGARKSVEQFEIHKSPSYLLLCSFKTFFEGEGRGVFLVSKEGVLKEI